MYSVHYGVRNGRVDRFGQRKEKVTIRTMVMDETLDAAILKVLVEKAARIREDYGFSPPYFGDETTILDLMAQHTVPGSTAQCDVRLGPKQLSLFDSMGPSLLDRAQAPAEDPFGEETLERTKEDSFYGQTHVSLPEIERRLEETAQTVGSPEQIQAFVFSGLHRFGCSVTENGDRSGRLDGSYRIGITEPALQTASVGEVIERATFDPEWALDDPDVTLLDVGHPLVRRLIEAVKQHTFYDEEMSNEDGRRYGRTAYVVTPDVDEVTALFHLLARYVVHTDPTSIIEELLPVAVPVYRLEPEAVGGRRAEQLTQAQPSEQTRTEGKVQEALSDALAIEGLDDLLEGAVETRRRELVTERERMRCRALHKQMERQEGSQHRTGPSGTCPGRRVQGTVPGEWLEGIDDLAPGSFDLLTVTVLFPA